MHQAIKAQGKLAAEWHSLQHQHRENSQICAKATILSRQEAQVQNGHKTKCASVSAKLIILCACEQYNTKNNRQTCVSWKIYPNNYV
jgi:hypothetical protein